MFLSSDDEIPLRAAISMTWPLVIQATEKDMGIVGRNVTTSAGIT